MAPVLAVDGSDFGSVRSDMAEFECARCGSDDIAEDQLVVAGLGVHTGPLTVIAYGDPNAVLFKDARTFEVRGDVCRVCGAEGGPDRPAANGVIDRCSRFGRARGLDHRARREATGPGPLVRCPHGM